MYGSRTYVALTNFIFVAVLCSFSWSVAAQTPFEQCPDDPPRWYYVEGLPGSSYEWTVAPGEVLEQQGNKVLVRWPEPGTYTVKVLETSAFGCEGDPIFCTIIVHTGMEAACEPQLVAPNIFSPNGDGTNDEFRITGDNVRVYRIEIFNRWGRLIYESDEIDSGWDGRVGNELAPSGTYFWVATYGNAYAKKTAKGHMMLK
ncbi:MAG: hypothetical protein RIS47_1868 [Bacteroidota bacterium]|jgi:gliding motility-associated-like protein